MQEKAPRKGEEEMEITTFITSPAAWWIIIFAALLIFELMTMGLTTIWFAGGALVAALVAFLGGNLVVQVVAFLIVSILLLLATRPIAVKHLNNSRVKTNADSAVGQIGIVTKTIDNIKASGTVELNGMEWTARSEDATLEIAEGSRVEIVKIEGVKVIVKPIVESE